MQVLSGGTLICPRPRQASPKALLLLPASAVRQTAAPLSKWAFTIVFWTNLPQRAPGLLGAIPPTNKRNWTLDFIGVVHSRCQRDRAREKVVADSDAAFGKIANPAWRWMAVTCNYLLR